MNAIRLSRTSFWTGAAVERSSVQALRPPTSSASLRPPRSASSLLYFPPRGGIDLWSCNQSPANMILAWFRLLERSRPHRSSKTGKVHRLALSEAGGEA
jgi:hypothetical protein